MSRITLALVAAASLAALPSLAAAGEIRGSYLETRTCQVYTGPCFANAEVGLTGNDAIMAWSIDEGQYQGIDLKGLKVVVVLRASETLGFEGLDGPEQIKSLILVDQSASEEAREALAAFAREHAGKAGQSVVKVESAPIDMVLDTAELSGKLEAGKQVKLLTRKAKESDCICTNEVAYYPPLAQVENFAPGVAIEGVFNGRGLGTRWSIPNSRSVYMATFAY